MRLSERSRSSHQLQRRCEIEVWLCLWSRQRSLLKLALTARLDVIGIGAVDEFVDQC